MAGYSDLPPVSWLQQVQPQWQLLPYLQVGQVQVGLLQLQAGLLVLIILCVFGYA